MKYAADLTVLAGWLLATFALSHLARGVIVWPLSLALLCFTAAGWRNLLHLALDGIDLTPENHNDA